MKTIKIMLGMLLIAGIWGCSTSVIKSDFDKDVDFSKFNSFNWMAQSQTGNTDHPSHNSLVGNRIKNAVDKELTSKGFQKDADGNPDFNVMYYLTVKEKVDVSSSGYGYPWGYGYGYGYRYGYGYGGIYTFEYDEGTLILDVIDPETNQLVWRGWYVDALKDGDKINDEKIALAVNHVLKDFPPQ